MIAPLTITAIIKRQLYDESASFTNPLKLCRTLEADLIHAAI
jgi:hypothetical protein